MNAIEKNRIYWGDDGRFEAVIEILPDECPSAPDEFDCAPAFVRACDSRGLAKQIAETFGAESWDRGQPTERARRIAARLASGEVVKGDDGTWYYGVAKYRHSGTDFALCCSQRHRNFPDQCWDVIGLCGWIKITRQNRIDWRIHGRKGVNEAARAKAKGALETWEAYLNGWYTGYTVELLDDGRLVEDASCWGFPGIEDAKEAAEDIVMYWQRQYPPAAETACDTP
jgi:hypothetical protein